MPTTRRGRFLFYKARARRRLNRVYSRAQNASNEPDGAFPRTARRKDVAGFPKQAARSYPLHFPFKWMTAAEWMLIGWTPPTKGRWGIARGWPGSYLDIPLWARLNGAANGYWDRRVKRLPRLKHIQDLPWNLSLPLAEPGNAYPFEFYPSGRRSYASLRGWV